jgi:hypothetical protein
MAQPSRVELEAIALMITDAVMREMVPIIDKHIRERSVAALTPLATEVAELSELVLKTREELHTTVKAETLDQRLGTIGEVCERFVDKAIAGVLERVQPFAYVGTFEVVREYSLNEFVTHKGCMWHARQRVPAGMVPGTDEAAAFWMLAVKCGRDAKGA